MLLFYQRYRRNIDLYQNLFPNYVFGYDLPLVSNVGGVGIYVKNTLTHRCLDDLKIPSLDNRTIENMWPEIVKGSKKYIIGGIYRHPGQDLGKFGEVFEKAIEQTEKRKVPCLIAGDFNIDLMKYGAHNITSNYVDNLLIHNFFPTIVMPTRIAQQSATIIDHRLFIFHLAANPFRIILSLVTFGVTFTELHLACKF